MTRLTLRAIFFLVVMFTVLSSVLTVRKHLTFASTLYPKKEIRRLNGEEFLSHPGRNWSTVTPRSLSTRMDVSDDEISTEDLIKTAAATGVYCFGQMVNDWMRQSAYTLTSEANGNGPDGWMFAPERGDHITSVLSQLSDELFSHTTYGTRDPRKWTNLDAAQDGYYTVIDNERPVSFLKPLFKIENIY